MTGNLPSKIFYLTANLEALSNECRKSLYCHNVLYFLPRLGLHDNFSLNHHILLILTRVIMKYIHLCKFETYTQAGVRIYQGIRIIKLDFPRPHAPKTKCGLGHLHIIFTYFQLECRCSDIFCDLIKNKKNAAYFWLFQFGVL